MTLEEAHGYIEDMQRILTQYRFIFSREMSKANGMAILALEKQIPKKPRKYKASKDLIYFECSRCDNKIQADVKYCSHCGQRLDWGDEK